MMVSGGKGYMNNIGASIKYLRKKHGMTQDILAEKLNISRQAISNWENGKTQPDSDMLYQLSVIFNQSIDEIINNKINENKKKNYYMLIPSITIIISTIHFILAMQGHINLIGVMISTLSATTITLIMHTTFENSIKNQDFTMIAGHQKAHEKEPIKYKKQLQLMDRSVGSLALLLNILYFAIYISETEKQMLISIIFFGVFLVGLISIIYIVNFKYKNNN